MIEFKNRDLRDPVLMARKQLKTKKDELARLGLGQIIVAESMCWAFKKLDFICRKLKELNKIEDTWFFNGKLFIIKHSNIKKQITHINDLFAIFDNTFISGLLR